MRASTAIRATAWAVVVAGVAAPALRRRLRARPAGVLALAGAAPFAACVAMRRSRSRDVIVCCLQMWAYVAAYEMPHDDPNALRRRVWIDYPIAIDRALGAGQPPTLRLQRRLGRPDEISPLDKFLVWAHWMWFAVPHAAIAYVLIRRYDLFERAAVSTYAVFDLGVIAYWIAPTAPPWYAARQGRLVEAHPVRIRRMMVEYGERFWRHRWGPLYDLLGGNPLAAMPSLHFATTVMAAHLLAETDPLAGAIGWSYAIALGFALVYLGEHYVADLLGGLALTEAVRRGGRGVAPLLERVGRGVQALEARAHA